MKITRVAVFRLFHGGYLTVTGQRHALPLQFTLEDAYRFRQAVRPLYHNDPLWGMSLELRPKRRKYTPMTSEKVTACLIAVQLRRARAEIDRCERMAESYRAQARASDEMAAKMRDKAIELRASLTNA